jgi:hypothetical protein
MRIWWLVAHSSFSAVQNQNLGCWRVIRAYSKMVRGKGMRKRKKERKKERKKTQKKLNFGGENAYLGTIADDKNR